MQIQQEKKDMFKILKNIPIPEKKSSTSRKGRTSIYPFGEMEIGDCIRFEANSIRDNEYKKVYNSAMGFARRYKGDYRFTFAEVRPGVFGCWKVKAENEPKEASPRKGRRTNAEIMNVKQEDIMKALKKSNSMAGAARSVGLSVKTFLRLKHKYDKRNNEKTKQ